MWETKHLEGHRAKCGIPSTKESTYLIHTAEVCEEVYKDLSDAIGLIAATYAPLVICSVWN